MWWYRSRLQGRGIVTAAMLPASAHILLGIDVATLRSTGVLERIVGSADIESAEYRQFVNEIHFDYRKDLDYVAAGLAQEANYFVLRGRFDGDALQTYARINGGGCSDVFCYAQTDAGRTISFYQPDSGTLALAIGSDRNAVRAMAQPAPEREPPPAAVAWAVAEKPALEAKEVTFAGPYLKMFEQADRVTASVEPSLAGLRANLAVLSADAAVLASIADQLSGILRSLDRKSSNLLVSALASGKLTKTETRIDVAWSLDARTFGALLLGERSAP